MPSGIFFYSETPMPQGDYSVVMKLTHETLDIRKKGPRDANYDKLAKIGGDISKLIAIYTCSFDQWQNGGTCLGKIGGPYSVLPPGATITSRGYVNPTTCFGNNSGYVLIDMCPDDCGNNYDDFGMTICIKNKD